MEVGAPDVARVPSTDDALKETNEKDQPSEDLQRPAELELTGEEDEGMMSDEKLARWKHMVSKILAKNSGVNWDAIVSSVRVLGFVPISEEAMEEMMQNQMHGRRRSVQAETRISGVDHSAAAAAAVAAYRASQEPDEEQPEEAPQPPTPLPSQISSQVASRRGSHSSLSSAAAAVMLATQELHQTPSRPADPVEDTAAMRKARFRLTTHAARRTISPQPRSPHVTRPTTPRPELEVDPDSPAGSVVVFRDTLERAFAVTNMVDALAEQRAMAFDTYATWAPPKGLIPHPHVSKTLGRT